MRRSNGLLFWPVVLMVIALDVVTKAFAEQYLVPQRIPHDVFGDWVRLTLVYNPGAAFGLHLGEQSRWIFMALTVAALVILARLYAATSPGARARALALALVCAGAVGNLLDRIRSSLGVVDFIDVGVGDARWPTFNVADIAVSSGAFLLAWVLWREDQEDAREGALAATASATASAPSAPLPSESGQARSV